MNATFPEAVRYLRELKDPLAGEAPIVEIPGSSPNDVKDSYTRKEAIHENAKIPLLPAPPGAKLNNNQLQEHERRRLIDRIQANGAEINDGYLYILSDESISTQRVALALGMTSAVDFYDTVHLPEQNVHNDSPVNEILAPESSLPKLQIPIAKRIPPAPIEMKSMSIPASTDTNPYVITAKSSNSRAFDTTLFRRILQSLKIKNCGGAIYAYDELYRYYRVVSDEELKMMINAHFGDEILAEGRLDKTYDTMVNLIHYETSIIINQDEQPNPYWWPFLNFIVDIRTNDLYPNDGGYFITYCIQCMYVPTAECPYFDQFLSIVAMNDPQVVQLLWETIGYILSPDHSAKKFFVFSGARDSGKSLLANMLVKLIGQRNTSSLSLYDFNRNFSMCDLIGKHLNVSMDLSNITLSRENIGKIKMLTGEDLIRADIKYKTPVNFYNTAKLLFGSNYSIHPEENDPAFLDRMVKIPFRYSVPKASQDPQLLRKLEMEFSGIANRAITAYLQLKKRNLEFTSVLNGSEHSWAVNYAELFLHAATACFEFTNRENDVVSSEDAYKASSIFCNMQMIEPEDRNKFSTRLREIGAGKTKKSVNGRSLQCFTGVQLKQQEHFMHAKENQL